MRAAVRGYSFAIVGLLLTALFTTLFTANAASAEPPDVRPLTASEQEQVQTSLAILTSEERVSDNIERWATAIRDLVDVGKPAVPLILVELDKTDKNVPLRHLAFTLRAIGDPRAIPALIRALPRTLMPPLSDYGLNLDDPELLKFMQQHQDDDGQGNEFHYGRPFREVVAALRKLSGTQHWEMELNFVSRGGSAEMLDARRVLFQRATKTWADWWSAHWQKFLKQEADAELELTQDAARPLPTMASKPRQTLPSGQNIVLDGEVRDTIPGEGELLDLDTGREPIPPDRLKMKQGQEPSPELIAWAKSQGADVIGVRRKAPGRADSYSAMLLLDLRIRAIDADSEKTLLTDLQAGAEFEVPVATQKSLPTVDDDPGTYVFITREGTSGFFRVQSGNEGMAYAYFFEPEPDVPGKP